MRIRTIFSSVACLLWVAPGWAQVDCLGVDGGTALPGTPCDDGQTFTYNDIWNVDCTCIGYCGGGPFGEAMVGGACDDGDPATVNDVWWPGCICHGWCIQEYGPPGTPCDDGDPLTSDDIVDEWGCYCSGWQNLITGQIFLDADLDGVFGGGDMPIQNRTVQAAPYIFTSSDASGNFEFRVSPGYYALLASSGSYDAPAQANPQLDLTTPGTSSTGNGLAMNPAAALVDLAVDLTTTPARPDFYNYITVICTNDGILPAEGELTLTFDAQQVYHNAYPAGTVLGNSISWTLPTLQLGEIFSATMQVRTPNGTPLGTTLTYAAQVTASPADGQPGNDADGFTHQVVGSFDPNDIRVEPELLTLEDVAQGTPVTYVIRFQNTGTYLAENVRIVDILPFELRRDFFEFVASSHPCHAQVNDRILQFHFDNIMLPDSNANEPESHGWVIFRMRPQNYLLPGATVGNSVSIYFDFNEPVITNTATFLVEVPMAIKESHDMGVHVWPNPAKDWINLAIDGGGTKLLSILDAQGRACTSDIKAHNDRATLPLMGMAPGLYIIRIIDDNGLTHVRFLKDP